MAKKASYSSTNLPQLKALCEAEGYLYEMVGAGQWRVYAATHVIDIWVARMKYHRLQGETIKSQEPYHDDLDERFNPSQVKKLLASGEL